MLESLGANLEFAHAIPDAKFGFGEYWQFAAACKKHGYTFEPLQRKTEDGWTLTVFHITGYLFDSHHKKAKAREAKTAGKLPVLAVTGSFGDAHHWFADA